ncbi:MAG: hypothetical protein K6F14_08620 [Clostridiales bacterium]|nr:hypothetical protein [Clostridiales bacterium]
MRKLTRVLTHVFVYALLFALLITTVSAVAGYEGYELVVEETSNFFPAALTGYKDVASYFGDEEEHIIYAEYRICAPGYMISEFDFELTYDEDSLEFVEGDIEYTPTGTIGEQTDVIPEISKYGEYSFDPWAESETEGRGRMTLHYMGYANASGEMDEDIVLVRVPFQIYSSDLGMVNIDMHVTTLTLSIIPVPGSDFAENAPTYDTLFVVADGMVNKEYDDLYSLITVLSPTGDDLIEHEEKTLTITGTSDFCPDVDAQVVKVGENGIYVTFVAPRDLEISYLSFSTEFEYKKISCQGADSVLENYGGKFDRIALSGADFVFDSPNPVTVKKGDIIAKFKFYIVGEGETNIFLHVTTQKGGHNVTIDMGGYMDNIVVEVEDGASLYDTLQPFSTYTWTKDGYIIACYHTKPLSEMKSASEYQSVSFVDRGLFETPVTRDITVYAIWLKEINFVYPDIKLPTIGSVDTSKPEITAPSDAHYTITNSFWSHDYPVEGVDPQYQVEAHLGGNLVLGYFALEADFGYIFNFDRYEFPIPSVSMHHPFKMLSLDTDYALVEWHYDNCIKSQDGTPIYREWTYRPEFVFLSLVSSGDENVDEKIEEIVKVIGDEDFSLDDAEAIKAAKKAYDELTDEQKKLVPPAISDKLLAYDVAVDIDSLPMIDKITPDDKEAIEAAKKAYEALTDEQKKLVPPEIVDKLMASEVTLAVVTLPDCDKLTSADKDAVKAAMDAFDKLTDAQKLLVPQEIVDKLKAADVITAILSLPDANKITPNDKDAIEAARKAYEELTEEQKKLVPQEVLDKLLSAEEALKKAGGNSPSVVIIIVVVVAIAAILITVIILIKKKKKK